jgi:hypothetical protein
MPPVAFTFAKVLSKPYPVEPKDRKGLVMPTLQLAPVMIWRSTVPLLSSPDWCRPKANSMTYGISRSMPLRSLFEGVDVAASG